MKKKAIILIIVFLIAGGILIFSSLKSSGFTTLSKYENNITIYKSGSCGCCEVYASYFKRKGNSDAKVLNLENLNSLKKNYGIPKEMESCHTTIIGDYFIEGHVPLEAIEKLLKEKPNIKGIAMPGMPSGSPGMPGLKKGDFIIYAVNHDGSYNEWSRI